MGFLSDTWTHRIFSFGFSHKKELTFPEIMTTESLEDDPTEPFWDRFSWVAKWWLPVLFFWWLRVVYRELLNFPLCRILTGGKGSCYSPPKRTSQPSQTKKKIDEPVSIKLRAFFKAPFQRIVPNQHPKVFFSGWGPSC